MHVAMRGLVFWVLLASGIASARPVFFSDYRQADRAHLMRAVKSAGLPAGTHVYYGTYGVNPSDAAAAAELPGGIYAPMFAAQGKAFPTRRVSAEEAARLDPKTAAFAGPVPMLMRKLDRAGHVIVDPATGRPSRNLSSAELLSWGVELGKRIRDHMRHATPVSTLQLDEIWPSASRGDAVGAALQQFLAGVLEGTHGGRSRLGDQPMKLIVHVAHAAALAAHADTPTYRHFLSILDKVSSHIVGEAYPPFRGGIPGALHAAHQAMRAAASWHGRGHVGASLGRKYLVGATAGRKRGATGALGGYQTGASARAMRAWRAAFLKECVRLGSAGLSEYNWTPEPGQATGGNAIPALMNEVFADVAHALGGGAQAHRAAPRPVKAHGRPAHPSR